MLYYYIKPIFYNYIILRGFRHTDYQSVIYGVVNKNVGVGKQIRRFK
nr:MAG TPA: hypothetical protein [Caudoviricetes sp.]